MTEAKTERRLALQLDGVSKIFPGVRALDNVDLAVYAGEIHGIVGENGAGKSTLMAVASGALVPEAGSVHIGGRPLRGRSPAEANGLGIAIVYQEPALLPDLTVAENLYFQMPEEHRPPVTSMRSWAQSRLVAWSPDVGIDPDARVEELKAEQRFIVDIVRAIAQEPVVLVLDEPTEHLAAEDVERLFQAVRDRVAAGGTVVYISHRIREVKQIADRISVLRDGCQRGTFDTSTVSERDIVNLIVGRELDAVFPAKMADDGGTPVFTAENLSGSRFSGLTLSVRPGEIVGFAGIEGNGQRDAVRSVAGLARRSGSMKVDGRPVHRRSTRIAYLSGDRHREGVFPTLTVRDTVGLRNLDQVSTAGFVRPLRERAFAQRAVTELAVKTPGIETPIESLSGGNQQKVLLASVMYRNPRVLIIDEPTQGVDVGAKTEIYGQLRAQASERGIAIIVVSSDGRELAGLCDRVLVFSRGHVVGELGGPSVSEAGITEALLTATNHRISAATRVNPVVRWLAGDIAPLAMAVAAILVLGAVTAGKSSFYLTGTNITGTLMLVAVLGFAAMGQTVALTVGAIDLSVGPLMGFVVVVESFFITAQMGTGGHVLGWALLILVPLAVGLVNWALVDLVKLNAIVATLITYIALQALSLVFRPQAGGEFPIGLTNALERSVGPVPIAFIVLVVVAVALQVVSRYGRFGLSLRAVGSDFEAARRNGVNPQLVRLAAFVLCSLLTGVSALALIAQVGTGDPTSGIEYTLTSISAAVIGGASIFGGRGSFIGAIGAAVLITQAIGAVDFLGLSTAWSSYLPGLMTLLAVAAYSKSRQLVARAS